MFCKCTKTTEKKKGICWSNFASEIDTYLAVMYGADLTLVRFTALTNTPTESYYHFIEQ